MKRDKERARSYQNKNLDANLVFPFAGKLLPLLGMTAAAASASANATVDVNVKTPPLPIQGSLGIKQVSTSNYTVY